MNKELKDFNYIVGIYDVVCRTIRMKIKEQTQKKGVYGIGVYTDRYCEQELMTLPMKKLEERMQIAACFEGVDFVFPVDSRDSKSIDEIAQKAYLEYVKEQKKRENTKQYKVGFVIGSFDVFHAGHLENLKLAKEICEKLVVVLKTDERILKNKHKNPKQSTSERAAVLKFLTLIEEIIYMDIDTTREDVINDVMGLYSGIEPKDIVAIFGSDLEEKEKPYINTEWANINVVFTDRDPEKMKVVSSSNYQRICDANGGIKTLEEREKEALLEKKEDEGR